MIHVQLEQNEIFLTSDVNIRTWAKEKKLQKLKFKNIVQRLSSKGSPLFLPSLHANASHSPSLDKN